MTIKVSDLAVDTSAFKHQATAARTANDNYARANADFYATPPEATEALLSVESFAKEIWEPACGNGAISKVLQAHGHRVHSSDLIDYGYGTPAIDFLLEWRPTQMDIITNPPFLLGEAFVRKALQLVAHNDNGKVAILHKLAFLEGKKRKKMFEEFPPARVWVFSWRVPFGKKAEGSTGTGLMAFAWYVFDRAHKGKTELGWL